MASPLFTIDGGSVGVKASVVAGATVTFALDSISGVQSTAWEVLATDESGTPASYTPNPSGSVNQTMTLTALTVGTAAIVKCTINGGIDHETEQASDEMWATAKFYVETIGEKEVLCAGELDDDSREASATHGAVEPINVDIRPASGVEPKTHSFTAAGGAGPTAITAYTLADGDVLHVVLNAVARAPVSGDSASYSKTYTFEATAGSCNMVGAVGLAYASEDDATWNITMNVSGADCRFNVTHDGAEDVDWDIFATAWTNR